MDSKIRALNPSHLAEVSEVVDLYEELAKQHKAYFNWNRQTASHELTLSDTLVIDHEGKVGGFITFRLYPDRIEIMALGVRPILGRQGLAGQLIAHLHRIAAERSQALWLEVHESNQQAIKFYYKQGFVRVQTRLNYYSDGGHALILKKQ